MVMCRFWAVTLLFNTFLLAGCSQTPIARMDSYLGLPTQGATAITKTPVDKSSGPFDVGLLVINDISAQDSAPALSDKARAFLTDQVRRRVNREIRATNSAEPIIDQMIGKVVVPIRTGSSSGKPSLRATHIPINAPMKPSAIETRHPPCE